MSNDVETAIADVQRALGNTDPDIAIPEAHEALLHAAVRHGPWGVPSGLELALDLAGFVLAHGMTRGGVPIGYPIGPPGDPIGLEQALRSTWLVADWKETARQLLSRFERLAERLRSGEKFESKLKALLRAFLDGTPIDRRPHPSVRIAVAHSRGDRLAANALLLLGDDLDVLVPFRDGDLGPFIHRDAPRAPVPTTVDEFMSQDDSCGEEAKSTLRPAALENSARLGLFWIVDPASRASMMPYRERLVIAYLALAHGLEAAYRHDRAVDLNRVGEDRRLDARTRCAAQILAGSVDDIQREKALDLLNGVLEDRTGTRDESPARGRDGTAPAKNPTTKPYGKVCKAALIQYFIEGPRDERLAQSMHAIANAIGFNESNVSRTLKKLKIEGDEWTRAALADRMRILRKRRGTKFALLDADGATRVRRGDPVEDGDDDGDHES